MSWFEYSGLTPGGTAISGRLEAASREQALQDIETMRIKVRELVESEAPTGQAAGLSIDDLIFFNDQLASLAEAGIALDQGLHQLARDVESPRLRRWIRAIADDVQRGTPLDQAVAAHERGLPVFYSEVIRAGMRTGRLSELLFNLNQHVRLMHNTRRVLWEAASYPLIVAILAVTIMAFFFVMIVPQFTEIYTEFDTRLPSLTLAMLTIARHFPTIVLVCVGAGVLAAIVGWIMRRSPGGRTVREGIVSIIPFIGRIHTSSLIARFLRAVSAAVNSGIPLPEALRLSSSATGNSALMADAGHLAGEVEQGRSAFEANQASRIIPPLFGLCVQTARGQAMLAPALDKLASAYEARARHQQSLLRDVMFPLMMIVIGAFLLLGILALFLPLVTLIHSMSGGF